MSGDRGRRNELRRRSEKLRRQLKNSEKRSDDWMERYYEVVEQVEDLKREVQHLGGIDPEHRARLRKEFQTELEQSREELEDLEATYEHQLERFKEKQKDLEKRTQEAIESRDRAAAAAEVAKLIQNQTEYVTQHLLIPAYHRANKQVFSRTNFIAFVVGVASSVTVDILDLHFLDRFLTVLRGII